MCIVPWIGAFEANDCSYSITNTQGYMDASGCGAGSKHSKSGLEATIETWDTSTKAATGVFNGLACLKNAHPNIKIGFSIGGWYDSNYFSAASVDSQRINFAKSIVRTSDAFDMD